MSLIGILGALLLVCVVCWATRAVLTAFSVPDPLATIIWVVVILLCLFWFLSAVGVLPAGMVRLR